MKVSELLKSDQVTISVELFPPKKGSQLENYKAIVGQMAELKPSYISCTYGATGGTSDYTVEIADTALIKLLSPARRLRFPKSLMARAKF